MLLDIPFYIHKMSHFQYLLPFLLSLIILITSQECNNEPRTIIEADRLESSPQKNWVFTGNHRFFTFSTFCSSTLCASVQGPNGTATKTYFNMTTNFVDQLIFLEFDVTLHSYSSLSDGCFMQYR